MLPEWFVQEVIGAGSEMDDDLSALSIILDKVETSIRNYIEDRRDAFVEIDQILEYLSRPKSPLGEIRPDAVLSVLCYTRRIKGELRYWRAAVTNVHNFFIQKEGEDEAENLMWGLIITD